MTYDYIIAGAGLGGLSFIHHLLDSRMPFNSVLVIDSDTKTSNDRTWSFWSTDGPIYECGRKQFWSTLGFACEDHLHFDVIDPYTYYTIHSADFYQEIFNRIDEDKRITFLQGGISQIRWEEHHVNVQVGPNQYRGEYVIDSISRPESIPLENIMLSQNFLGWKISTDYPVFDSAKPILMDFRVAQNEAPSFVYYLPYSETEALIEYTQFSKDHHFDRNDYESELENYISHQLGLKKYVISEREEGSIPMTNYQFDNRPHRRVFRIGTVGGDTKSTTGYTFMNVQKHAIRIIEELQGLGVATSERERFLFYDALLLQIIKEQPLVVMRIMKFLFKNQPMSRVLKFLDEDTTLSEEMLIMGQLPWQPFLSTLLKRTQNAITT